MGELLRSAAVERDPVHRSAAVGVCGRDEGLIAGVEPEGRRPPIPAVGDAARIRAVDARGPELRSEGPAGELLGVRR